MSPKTKRKISKGTGKRYPSTKPRPMAEAVARVRPPAASQAEKTLRKRILKFVYQGDRFKADVQKAMELYFEQTPGPDMPVHLDQDEMPGFQEWFFFDFVTYTGRRIIDLFMEKIGPSLNSEQRAMLEDWLVWNRARLLEFQEIKPGIGVVVQDLLSDEILEVNDISASYNVSRWMFGLFRPIRSAGRVSFTGTAMLLPPSEKESILETARALWAKYQAEHPKSSLPDFYRDNSLTLHLAMKRAQEEASNPPIPLSSEGHSLVLAWARYLLRVERRQVEAVLDASEEFVYAGPSEERRGALHYNWIQRGRSFVPLADQKPKKRAVMLRTEWTEGPGHPSFLNLGDLTLGPKWIELECLSRERLAAGKVLLEEILTGLIEHSGDRFEGWEKSMARSTAKPPKVRKEPSRKMKEEMEILDRAIPHYLTTNWLDEPSVDGKLTPRQAVQSPEGRKKVIEALKQIEYINDQRALDGQGPTMDADYIRRELGLSQAEKTAGLDFPSAQNTTRDDK
jgi:hypothetical protein